MNDKFFSLPKQKQQTIINAGYRVFSQNTYKKSPMIEIADAAGISKSLLFHYFHNKKEFYLYLWENCGNITIQVLTQYGCYEQNDLFEMMYRGMRAKIHIMKRYPYMGAFVMRAIYESDPSVQPEIQKSYHKFVTFKADQTLANLDPDQFVEGVDPSKIRREMYLATEGYLWELQKNGSLNTEKDLDQLEQDFMEMMQFWKQVYLRKKG